MRDITYQGLRCESIPDDLLDGFERYQEVSRWWRRVDDRWILVDSPSVSDWDLSKKRRVTQELLTCARNGGVVFGARCQDRIIGFAALQAIPFGRTLAYRQMSLLQVSNGYRRSGVGKRLFELVVSSARNMGAKRIYISAHSAEASLAFYKAVGCVEAEEINPEISAREPYDCQMEYVL